MALRQSTCLRCRGLRAWSTNSSTKTGIPVACGMNSLTKTGIPIACGTKSSEWSAASLPFIVFRAVMRVVIPRVLQSSASLLLLCCCCAAAVLCCCCCYCAAAAAAAACCCPRYWRLHAKVKLAVFCSVVAIVSGSSVDGLFGLSPRRRRDRFHCWHRGPGCQEHSG